MGFALKGKLSVSLLMNLSCVSKATEKKWEAKREQLKKFLYLLFLSEEQRQKCKGDQTNGKHIETKQKGCQLSSKLHTQHLETTTLISTPLGYSSTLSSSWLPHSAAVESDGWCGL